MTRVAVSIIHKWIHFSLTENTYAFRDTYFIKAHMLRLTLSVAINTLFVSQFARFV